MSASGRSKGNQVQDPSQRSGSFFLQRVEQGRSKAALIKCDLQCFNRRIVRCFGLAGLLKKQLSRIKAYESKACQFDLKIVVFFLTPREYECPALVSELAKSYLAPKEEPEEDQQETEVTSDEDSETNT